MAERGESEGFASSTLDQNGARPKDSYFPLSDASKSALRENLKGWKLIFYESLDKIEEGANCQGVNLQEALLQFVAEHHDHLGIYRNSG